LKLLSHSLSAVGQALVLQEDACAGLTGQCGVQNAKRSGGIIRDKAEVVLRGPHTTHVPWPGWRLARDRSIPEDIATPFRTCTATIARIQHGTP
jgi:hypothetical protein